MGQIWLEVRRKQSFDESFTDKIYAESRIFLFPLLIARFSPLQTIGRCSFPFIAHVFISSFSISFLSIHKSTRNSEHLIVYLNLIQLVFCKIFFAIKLFNLFYTLVSLINHDIPTKKISLEKPFKLSQLCPHPQNQICCAISWSL